MARGINSSNTKFSLLVLLIIIFTMFIPTVFAEIDINTYSTSFDFTANIPNNLEVCSCGSTSGYISVKNIGTYPAKFYITSSNNELFSVIGYEYSIKSGQKLLIPYNVKTDCGFAQETVTISIWNSFNIVKEYTIEIQGLSCQNLAAEITYDKQTVKPCEPILFTLNVENIGDFTETYYFDFGDFTEFITSDYGSVTLPAREVGSFDITLELPCEYYGNYSIPTNVYTTDTEYGLSFKSEIEVLREYNFSNTLPAELFSCGEETELFKFNITNEASIDNTYSLKSLYPNFIKLITKELSLEPGKSGIVEFEVKGFVRNIGFHDFGIDVKTGLGDLQENLISSLYLGRCYSIEIIPEQEYFTFGGRELENFAVTIKNNGDVAQDIYLGFPFWTGTFFFDEPEFTLASGAEKIITVDVSNVPDKDMFYYIPIKANIVGTERSFIKEIRLDVISSYVTHRVIIEPKVVKINYDDNISYFSIKNIGSRKLWYNVTITPYDADKSSWIHIPDSLIIELEPMAHEVIKIEYDPEIYVTSEDDYLFNVALNPMYTYDDLIYENELKIKLRDKSFFYYAGVWIYSNPILVIIIVVILLLLWLLLYLLISRPKNLEEKKKRKKKYMRFLFIWAILAILALILLLLLCPFKSLYPALDDNPDDLNITIYSGDDCRVNLDKYFDDPDGDTLEYYVKLKTLNNETEDNFIVNFEGSEAVIYPKENVSGVIPIWFYATDSKFFAKSDMFMLSIVEKPQYTFSEIVDYYICYLLWLAVVVFVFIYVIATLIWSNKRTKRQHDNDKKLIL